MSIFSSFSRQTSHGFTLIEVLVTMVIVAFGLMGLISLMLNGLRANATSSFRTTAVSQAYDMADKMRANYKGVNDGNYSSILPPGSSATCPIATTDPVAPPTATALAATTCATCSTSCTPAQVAARDACLWHQQNNKALPLGAGAVCKESGKEWYAITVSWDEEKTGQPNRTFTLRFEP